MSDTVQRALVAAQIPPERLGPQRTARLDASTRAFYQWILRSVARTEAPDSAALAGEAERLGLDVATALAALAQEDLVHTDRAGAVAVAYPFSGQPTRHRVRLGEHEVYAMCAIDALGMASMFKVAVLMESLDPVTGDAIRVELAADGDASWTPEDAVVVAGSCCAGDAYEGCCQVLNLFAAPTHAERYLAERPEASGHVISIPEAIAADRAIFGDVLADTR